MVDALGSIEALVRHAATDMGLRMRLWSTLVGEERSGDGAAGGGCSSSLLGSLLLWFEQLGAVRSCAVRTSSRM